MSKEEIIDLLVERWNNAKYAMNNALDFESRNSACNMVDELTSIIAKVTNTDISECYDFLKENKKIEIK